MKITEDPFHKYYFNSRGPTEILKLGLNPILLSECSRLEKEENKELEKGRRKSRSWEMTT